RRSTMAAGTSRRTRPTSASTPPITITITATSIEPDGFRMSTSPLETLRAACASPLEHASPDWLRAAGQQVMDAMLDDYVRLGQDALGHTGSRQELERLL